MGRVGLGVAVGCAAVTCAIAAALVARRASARARWRRAVALLREFEEGCATPPARLRQVVDAMVVEMHAGLASDGGSKLKMLLTFVDALPSGSEEGVYYSIDLGGTNFRVLRVQVGAGSVIVNQKVEQQPIPEELTKGTTEGLFNFVALALKNFLEGEDDQDGKMALGFTFSFPVRQISVSSGSLIRWTKGFSIRDTAQGIVEGPCVVICGPAHWPKSHQDGLIDLLIPPGREILSTECNAAGSWSRASAARGLRNCCVVSHASARDARRESRATPHFPNCRAHESRCCARRVARSPRQCACRLAARFPKKKPARVFVAAGIAVFASDDPSSGGASAIANCMGEGYPKMAPAPANKDPPAALLQGRLSQRKQVGRDVAQCLNEALANCGLNVRVTALVNDTVGTLALGHYYDEDTVAAVIIGSGTNACYIERTDAIIKCQGLLTNSGGMVVNMEWGNFWSSHLPRTPYDILLDDETHNRNDQGFEKMISGMYLGEIARLVFHRMAQESDVFGDAADSLSNPFILSTPFLAAIREDDSPDLSEVRRILREHLKIPDAPLKTRRLVVKVCDIVTRRAARLAAAGIVGILKKLGRDGSGAASSGRGRGQPRRTVVAIEGGLYQGYPVFREYLDEALVEILGEEVARNVTLRVTEDGSGVGAALLAAVHSSNRQQQGGPI
ncbi:hypothetical protein OsJ_04720 [Oryza sativa Japonica Group]|uniref:hexokinase n=1 Tax=Oryza sativa subsp. japonica TaxID=39947 RepID=B9EWE0_ORYSJ|nr:hypothetical protein OsJ_04720 [Oryza sativa Japonica Group]